MSSLNIMCAICNEFYKINDTVYSTAICGHLFHHQCLMRWLRRSNTCPQCRRVCHPNRIHRVYLNYGERTAADDEAEGDFQDIPMWIPLDEPTSTGAEEVPPKGGIVSGLDPEGNEAYVARVYFEEDLLPANYVPKKGGAYTPYNCRAHFVRNNVEVLIDSECEWLEATNGHVPPDALVTGYSETGENLYTGRAVYNEILLPGKVHPSHGVMYMPYNGQEVNIKQYEVLVRKHKKQPEK